MAKYNILHVTKYHYASPVRNSANQVILFPKSEKNQTILEQNISISPASGIDYFQDYFDNKIGMFTVTESHSDLTIRSELRVEIQHTELPISKLPVSEEWANLDESAKMDSFIDFLQIEKINSSPAIISKTKELVSKEKSVLDCVEALSRYINKNFEYKQGVTTIETQLDEIWEAKLGVCQDFAHMLIAMLRELGIPSRYVSGYICPSNVEMRGEGATHAWVEVYVPSIGWIGIDPTNDCWVSDRHVKIAYGRDFKDCTPIKGTYEGTSDHTLYVSVVITGDDGSRSPIFDEDELTATYTSSVQEKDNVSGINLYQRFIQQQQQQQ